MFRKTSFPTKRLRGLSCAVTSRNMDFPLRCLSTGVAATPHWGWILQKPIESNHLYRHLALHPLFMHSTCFKVLPPLSHTLHTEGDLTGGNQQLRPCRQMAPFPVSLPTFFDLRKVKKGLKYDNSTTLWYRLEFPPFSFKIQAAINPWDNITAHLVPASKTLAFTSGARCCPSRAGIPLGAPSQNQKRSRRAMAMFYWSGYHLVDPCSHFGVKTFQFSRSNT